MGDFVTLATTSRLPCFARHYLWNVYYKHGWRLRCLLQCSKRITLRDSLELNHLRVFMQPGPEDYSIHLQSICQVVDKAPMKHVWKHVNLIGHREVSWCSIVRQRDHKSRADSNQFGALGKILACAPCIADNSTSDHSHRNCIALWHKTNYIWNKTVAQ